VETELPGSDAPAKSKRIAGLLAIFLGALGVHRFYLGRLDGVFYLLLVVLGLWMIVVPFCVIQGIAYLLSSDARWARISSPRTAARSGSGRRRSIISASLTLIIVLGLFVYVIGREEQAKADAHAFCDAVAVGDPVASVKARAKGLGVDMLRRITDGEVAVGFVGIPPFSRHICTVHAKDGRVTFAKYFYLD